MKICRVFYACWQMQCCGDPFKIDDTVEWLVCEPTGTLGTTVDIGCIDYWYEAHDSEIRLFHLTGTVTAIMGLFERYAPSEDNSRLLVPVYVELMELPSADGWEESRDDLEISGYVVELTDYSIEPM